jgi:MoaE-MoaD fusion protein
VLRTPHRTLFRTWRLPFQNVHCEFYREQAGTPMLVVSSGPPGCILRGKKLTRWEQAGRKPMRVRVLFFGFTHDLTGFEREEIDLPHGESIEGVWRRYENRFPRLAEVRGSLLVAVNEQVAARSSVLQEGDEVAFLPPVSGGAPAPRNDSGGKVFFRLSYEVIDSAELARRLKSPEAGAVVIFEGIVRNNLYGRKTLYLEYEAYEPMALLKMEQIAQEATEKFSLDGIALEHRLGRLQIGETSVAIVVTAPHRLAAFEACHYAIDRLKQIVPIWKKEHFEDGVLWAEGEQSSSTRRMEIGGEGSTPLGGSHPGQKRVEDEALSREN